MKKNIIRLNEEQFFKMVKKMVNESVNAILKEEYHDFRKFPDEMPEPFKKLVVRDANGNGEGHLSTPIVWDGEHFRTDLAHSFNYVDPDNIVAWKYLNEI